MLLRNTATLAVLATLAVAQAQTSQLELGRKAIQARTGCYLVDYSFVETDPIKPGYTKDNRVYDVNRDKSIKEWIVEEDISPTRIRLQHVLLGVGLDGKLMPGSLLKHTGEDWDYNAPFLYEFAGSSTWTVKGLGSTPNLWTRRVVSLDDGPRYDCAAPWKADTAYPEWTCNGLSPIPGRETRDMHRKDYTLLDRSSRIVDYGTSWLEREENTKIAEEGETRAPLAKEVGKTFYVRLPDTECSAAQDFVKPRLAFWNIVREAWDGVLTGKETFAEVPAAKGQPSRYEQMMKLEEKYMGKDLNDPAITAQAKAEVTQVILAHRKL